MKVAELALSGCVVALAIFVGVQARNLRRVTANDASLTTAVVSPGVVDSALASASAGSNPYERPVVSARTSIHVEAPLSPVELRRILDSASVGTYIRELLQSRDSTLARWPDHRTEPLRVWIAEPVQLNGWNERFPSSVRDAFDTWAETGVPLRFSYVYDSAGADVHVRFLPRFPTGISGKTLWTRNTACWMVDGDIVLSLTHPSGGSVTPLEMRAIALHEVGHLLGLDHTSDATNIMSARIRVRDLSGADRATIRLLYSVPAGSAREGGYQRTTTVRNPP